jgi:putative ABC transport system permease protein
MFRHKRAASDFSAEVEAHLELESERLRNQGLTEEQARAAAHRSFGNVMHVEERFYESGRWLWWDNFWQDLRYAARTLCNKPTFTIVAVLTLAVGVGANTAIFSIVNAVLLRPLPFRNPDRLVRIFFNNPGVGMRDVVFSMPELDDLRDRSGVFDDVCTVGGGSVNLTGGSQPERLEFAVSHPNYFSMLGATPQIGRLYGPQDFALGFAPVAVLTDGLWRRSFGGDPNVLGRTLLLDNDAYTIIGVLPPGFHHLGPTVSENAELFLTAGFSADPTPKPARNNRFMPAAMGRLKPGITLGQAQARLTAMAVELRHDFPTDYPAQSQWTIEIQSLQESLVGNVRPMLLVLLGAVFIVVFIVSLNIANLLLAGASGRQQEMALRSALGAGRGRIMAQMLTESVLLSILGGLAGIATAFATLRFILRVVPSNIPRLSEVRIDWVVLGFALLLSLFTGVLFGLAPAFQAAKSTLSAALREGGRGSGYSSKTSRLRDFLIVSELAFAVVLMVGAGLLLRTLGDLLRENPGFNPTQAVKADVWLPVPNDPKADPYLGNAPKTAFYRESLRRMTALPGVTLAAFTSELPATVHPDVTARIAVSIEDRPVESSLHDLRAERIRITPDYFRVMQAPLVRGRFFTEADQDGNQLVAIIDESTARSYWTDRDPLGRHLRFEPAGTFLADGKDPSKQWITVVGIVKDIKHDGLDANGIPHIYVSIYQSSDRQVSAVLRTSLPAKLLEPQIRHEIQSVDPSLPVFHVSSMNEVLDASLASRRFSADLVGGFAGMALLLASIGIYGLLAYMVGQRSREIGLRIALGAQPADVLRLVLGKGVVLAAVGIVAGMLVSTLSASMMATLLYGVRPHDPAVFLLVPMFLFAVAVLASYLPARRATKVDPMLALREA